MLVVSSLVLLFFEASSCLVDMDILQLHESVLGLLPESANQYSLVFAGLKHDDVSLNNKMEDTEQVTTIRIADCVNDQKSSNTLKERFTAALPAIMRKM